MPPQDFVIRFRGPRPPCGSIVPYRDRRYDRRWSRRGLLKRMGTKLTGERGVRLNVI